MYAIPVILVIVAVALYVVHRKTKKVAPQPPTDGAGAAGGSPKPHAEAR